jgi:RHS repeat-associated protein
LTLTIGYDFDGHFPSLLYRMPTVIATQDNVPTDLAPASKGDSFSCVHGPGIDDHRSRGRLGGDCHRQPAGRDERERASQLFCMTTTTSGSVYYHQDGLGSTVALTDAAGAKIESYTYDVFGTVSIFDAAGFPQASSSVGNRFLYTGRDHRSRGRLGGDSAPAEPAGRDERERTSQLITELNLYDYRNRVYSAELGRFLQTDPIRFDAGDVNLYRYVGNSVADKIDPFGLEECCHPKQLKPDPEHIRQCNEAAIACNAAVAVAYASCMRVCTAVPHPLGRASCVIGCQLILTGHAYCEATRQVCIKNAPKVCI